MIHLAFRGGLTIASDALGHDYNGRMNDLKNRIALITGGSRGIGAAIAIALARGRIRHCGELP